MQYLLFLLALQKIQEDRWKYVYFWSGPCIHLHQECQSLQQQTVIPKKRRKGQESQTKRRSFGSQASPTQEASPMEDEEDEIPGVVKKGGKQVGCVSNMFKLGKLKWIMIYQV